MSTHFELVKLSNTKLLPIRRVCSSLKNLSSSLEYTSGCIKEIDSYVQMWYNRVKTSTVCCAGSVFDTTGCIKNGNQNLKCSLHSLFHIQKSFFHSQKDQVFLAFDRHHFCRT